MMSEARTFRLSQAFLASRRRLMVVLAVAMAGAVALTVLAAADFDLRRIDAPGLVIAIAMTAMLLALVFGVGLFLERGWRRLSVRLDDTGLVREAGATRQAIAWADVARIRVRGDAQGRPVLVEVFSRKGRPMHLTGIEPMDELVSALRARLPAGAGEETRRQRFDWRNVWVMGGLVAAAMLTGLLVAAAGFGPFGEALRQWLKVVWALALGAFFLIYAPGSRANPGFRTIELVFGAGLIAFGLYEAARSLL